MNFKIKKLFFRNYLINLIILNLLFFPLSFYQFERPLISIETFLFSLSNKLFVIGIFYELITTLFASLQITPDLIFFSFWLNNINFDFLLTFMETYTLAILLIIFSLFYKFKKIFIKSNKLSKLINIILITCISFVILLILNRPLIKLYFNDMNEIQKIGSTSFNLVKNVFYQRSIKNDLITSDFLNEKFDINNIELKDYNKVYFFIMESYPLFVNKDTRNKVESFMLADLNNYRIKKQYKNWYPKFSTLGQEFYIFCGSPPKNVNEILLRKDKISNYFKNNQCLIDQLKKSGYNLNFIHTYKSSFNNRSRYYKYFDKTYFFEDLIKKDFNPDCNWYEIGVCDYQVLDRFHEIFDLKEDKNIYYFLTLNGHVIPQNYFIKKGNKLEDCNTLDLKLSSMCKVYNNQIQFNKSLNQFIKKNLNQNELVIALGDTPPYFLEKNQKRLVINDYVPVYLIEKY